ncbi:MAG: metallophosphoesterase [Verrucomicrobiota bacterium]
MSRAHIHPDVILDGRLAIFHERSRWLALADLHFGYEIEFRRAGGLFPMVGMEKIEERLTSLIEDYEPERVFLAGDLVHGRASNREMAAFCRRMGKLGPQLTFLAGNHDRGAITTKLDFEDFVRTDGFYIHHGHLPSAAHEDEIEVVGHHHPAITLRDGAGLKIKLPSLIQESHDSRGERWILPAFSPWAGGTTWKDHPSCETRRWACSPQRVFEIR